MIEARPARPGEIEAIGKQAAEIWVREQFLNDGGGQLAALLDRPHTQVALIDGTPVAVGGFIDRGDGNAIAWSAVGIIPRESFVSICRVFRRGIEATPFDRIEAHCFADFTQSLRWVRCLGFKQLGPPETSFDGRPFIRFLFRNYHHGN